MSLFELTSKVAVVTGGGGRLGSAIAVALAEAGATVAVTGVHRDRASQVARTIEQRGGSAAAYTMDVMNAESVADAAERIALDYDCIDILVNCVGGNIEQATTSESLSFFDLASDDLKNVMALNLLGGVIIPCQKFGSHLVKNAGGGSIINISSMAAQRPLTRVVGYGAAKAAVENFTKWLAVHFAREYSRELRVNAVAPGFFLTDQNRFLLQSEDGGLTERGRTIIDHTPMARFGEPRDVVGAVLWLASDASRFVTGIVVPVDGGFSAYAGV